MAELIEAAVPVLSTQHALITRRQVVGLTGSENGLRQLLRSGVWETVDAGLYGPAGVPMSWRRSLMAAVLLSPPGSLVSHRAAATLQGVGGLVEPTPEITIPRGTRVRRTWLITHESLDLAASDVVHIDHIPTTGPRRLAVDLGGVVSFERFKHSIRELRHQHGLESRDLLLVYLRHKRQGRTGGGALRRWLDRYFGMTGGALESGAELVVFDAVVDAGLPAPITQFWVEVDGRRFRLDLAWPDRLVCLEVDGVQHDDDPDVRRNDVERERLLTAAGWTVLHVRARSLASDLPQTLSDLATILATPLQKLSQDPGGQAPVTAHAP